MESVWRERAARLSRRRDSGATPQDLAQVVVFQIGDERYGIEISRVAGVVAPVECTPVPGAPHALAGIIEVHGEIRPVLDLRRMLGLESSGEAGEALPVVLIQRRGRQIGLRVDRVEQVRSLPRADLRPAGDGAAGLSTRYLESLTPDTLMLLSADSLFAELSKEAEAA